MGGYAATLNQRPDHLAVVCETESLTYAELDQRASALAHVLRAAGAEPGGRVAVMLPNCIEFVECLAATAKLRCASLTLNWHLRSEELSWILHDSGAQVLVAHTDLRDVVEAAANEITVLWVGDDYEMHLDAADAPPITYGWPTSWPVIYTSGTSGRPKGVVHGAVASPEIMTMAQDGLLALWGYNADDIHLAAGPLYHAAPSGYTNTTLYAGGTVVIMDSWEPLEFLRLVETHRVTTTFLTPAHFIRLLEIAAIDRARFDTTSLRHVIHAGAPCPVDVKQQIISAFPRAEVWEFYGMSEGGATRVSTEEWLERPGTVGRPWPGVAITIRDPDTLDPVEAGADGLVYVTPAHGRFHYHHDDQKTSAAWHESSFTVGDIGHLDADGYLFLTDRASDLVIRSGVNISPRQIEDVLYRHDAVVDCAVFGVPDDRDGERLRAVVEVRPASAGEVDAATLEEWCRRHLDAFVVPGEFVLVDDLPRDPNGKILKRLLRDAAWTDEHRAI